MDRAASRGVAGRERCELKRVSGMARERAAGTPGAGHPGCLDRHAIGASPPPRAATRGWGSAALWARECAAEGVGLRPVGSRPQLGAFLGVHPAPG